MKRPSPVSCDLDQLAARELVLRFMSLAASDPASSRFERIYDSAFLELTAAAAHFLAQDRGGRPAQLACGEEPPERLDLTRVLEALREPRQRLADDHVRVFGLVVSKECPPYEVQYCPQTFSVYRSQQMADVAGFFRGFGVTTGRDLPERVDHIACELEFLAWLAAKERYARHQEGAEWAERAETCRRAQRDFLSAHFAWWVPAFARALAQRVRTMDPPALLCAALAPVLAALVALERAALGVDPPSELVRPRAEDEDGAEQDCASCSLHS